MITFALQIYFDFAGYTDMAIGLGRMFGFQFTENFNFPYISRSIKEFWQRWHITLSTWLRDYLFLPIAYSSSRKMKAFRYAGIRADKLIYLIATLVTFLICGFWHGAAWNFIVWGLLHGILLTLEQFGLARILKRIYVPIRHLYVLFFLSISWVFFRTDSLSDAFQYLGTLFGFGEAASSWVVFREYFNTGFILVLLIALVGSTKGFGILARWFEKLSTLPVNTRRSAWFHASRVLAILLTLGEAAFATLNILADTNNSFIYFKF